MSRTQQDQFIDDDEEETCPLCVEEFDLSDRGFRPCPCGYQVRGPLFPLRHLSLATRTDSGRLDMPVLLPQCAHQHEWSLPGMSKTLRRRHHCL